MSANGDGRAWDWSDDARDLVVQEQPAIAVYTNPANAVVIRQAGAWNDDEDAWIWFSPDHALAIAKAILEAAGLDAMALAPEPEQAASKAKDPTAAERQRRRRARQKEPELDIDRDVTVVTRDGKAA